MALPKGHPKMGGRKKGTPNRITLTLKDMILGALEAKGGQAYFERQAEENPVAFMALIAKVLPVTLQKNESPEPVKTITSVNTDWETFRANVSKN